MKGNSKTHGRTGSLCLSTVISACWKGKGNEIKTANDRYGIYVFMCMCKCARNIYTNTYVENVCMYMYIKSEDAQQ